MRWSIVAVLLLGCVNERSAHPVRGTPDDVLTAPGSYAGYDVVAPCERAGLIGVVGRGSITPATTNAIGAHGGDLFASMQDVPSIWGGAGFGLSCLPGIGTNLYLDDWRDVDVVIERTGAFLRQRDLAMQVGIEVSSIPVPH